MTMRVKLLLSLLLLSCNRHTSLTHHEEEVSSKISASSMGSCNVGDITPSSEVNNFHDVVQHLSKTKYRVTYVDYDDCVEVSYETPINRKSKILRNHYARLAQSVDESNLVNYQCDTIQIYDGWCGWFVGDVYNSPYSNYSLDFKCGKGLYELVDYRLVEKQFDAEYVNEQTRAIYEEIRRKDYPDLDALPLTYDWEMLRYNCWDDQKMIRNFGERTDVRETLIRIIIKNNRIVYCDGWDW